MHALHTAMLGREALGLRAARIGKAGECVYVYLSLHEYESMCLCLYACVLVSGCMYVCVCVWACLLQGGGLVPIAFLSVLISVYSICLNTCVHLLIMLYVRESTYIYMTTFVCHVFVCYVQTHYGPWTPVQSFSRCN